MVLDKLNDLKTKTPGCRVVALADVSSAMILATDTQSKLPRDQLNILAGEAVLVLPPPQLESQDLALTGPVVIAEGSTVKIFVRSGSVPSDVICAIFDDTTTVSTFNQAAQSCLSHLSSDA